MTESDAHVPAAPETWYCGQCARQAVLVDTTDNLARYVCALKHFTIVDLTKMKPKP
jgi:hypothetical protein